MFTVPAQSGLCGYGGLYGVDNGLCNLKHEGDVLQETGASAFSSNLLDWTAEIDVDNVWMRGLFNNLGGFGHGNRVFSIYLNGYGAFFLVDCEFFQRALDHSCQSVT